MVFKMSIKGSTHPLLSYPYFLTNFKQFSACLRFPSCLKQGRYPYSRRPFDMGGISMVGDWPSRAGLCGIAYLPPQNHHHVSTASLRPDVEDWWQWVGKIHQPNFKVTIIFNQQHAVPISCWCYNVPKILRYKHTKERGQPLKTCLPL